MFASRVPILCRALRNASYVGANVVKTRTPQLQSIKHSGDWTYRTGCAPHEKKIIIWQHLLGGCKYKLLLLLIFSLPAISLLTNQSISFAVMWWWIFWHFWHDWGHIVGEFPYPEPEKWTNAELGIPPDDEDD